MAQVDDADLLRSARSSQVHRPRPGVAAKSTSLRGDAAATAAAPAAAPAPAAGSAAGLTATARAARARLGPALRLQLPLPRAPQRREDRVPDVSRDAEVLWHGPVGRARRVQRREVLPRALVPRLLGGARVPGERRRSVDGPALPAQRQRASGDHRVGVPGGGGGSEAGARGGGVGLEAVRAGVEGGGELGEGVGVARVSGGLEEGGGEGM